MFLCISGCVTCCFIQLIDQGSTVFFQEREDISSFCGLEEGIVTGSVGPSFVFTEGSNFSVFFGWGSIFIVGVSKFTRMLSVSVSLLSRTAYLLLNGNDLIGTVGRLVSTVQTENPSLVLHQESIGECPFLLGPSWPAELQTSLH